MDEANTSERVRPALVPASDGYALRYRVWPASTPEASATVVLLNGIMSNSAWFSPIARRLPSIHLVGADRRGSGPNRSGRGDAPSAAQLVDDVVRIVDAEHRDDRPLVLLGWCWGAALAIHAAVALGQRVGGIVLVTPGLFPTAAVKQAVSDQRDRIARAAADDAVIESPIAEEMFTEGPALEGFIRRDEDRLRAMTPRLLDISGKLAATAVARLRRLSVPILVVFAADDEATDNFATRDALSASSEAPPQYVELSSAHGVQFDAPDGLAHHIEAFVQRVGEGRP